MFRRLFSKDSTVTDGSTNHVGLVYVDAENCKTSPKDLMSTISKHNGSKPSEAYAYSKWSAKSVQTKKYRTAGFRLQQADSGDNNADIMMCLDAYQRVRDLSDNGISGNVYICFHGDKGFTHLLEKLRTINDWNSVWVTSNTEPNKMIKNSASVTLRVSVPEMESIKKSPVNQKDTTISDSGKNFERINGFNNSGKGMRFPLKPETLANILLLNSEFEKGIKRGERADVISEKLGVGRRRVSRVLIHLFGLELMKEGSSLEAVKELRLRFESSYKELGDWSPEEVEKIQQYFARAQENLE